MILKYFSSKKKCWDIIEKYYPVYEGKKHVIESMIRPYLKKDIVLVDAGCGQGKETVLNYKNEVNTSYGVDISEIVKFNPTIHFPIIADVCNMPFSDSCVDMVVSQELIEHIERPEIFFQEVARILKSRGVFIFATPNLLSWKSIISCITPYKLHKILNKQLHGINEIDVFLTYYRMNRLKIIDKYMRKVGMYLEKLVMWEGTPRTLTFNRLTTYIDILITTMLRKYNFLRNFRELIIASYRKC